jgi:hypothetical protein
MKLNLTKEFYKAAAIEADTPVTAGNPGFWTDGPNAPAVIWQVTTKDEAGNSGPFGEFEVENAAKNAAWEWGKTWNWIGVRIRPKDQVGKATL